MSKSGFVVLLLSLGVAMGLVLTLVVPSPSVPHTTEWLERPHHISSFSLESEQDEFNNQSLTGRWTIVLFGFLHCSDICPTGLAQMAKLSARLAESTGESDIAFVFVSVDPGRDSAAEVGQFVRYFDSSFLGVTGSEEQLAKFSRSLGVQFKVSPDPGSYSVAHSITFSIIDPDGDMRGRFRPGFDALRLAEEIASKI